MREDGIDDKTLKILPLKEIDELYRPNWKKFV